MKKMGLVFIGLAFGLLASCGSDDEIPNSNDRYLIRPINCNQNDIDALVNCEPTLALCEDGRAVVYVNMNVSDGTYTETEGKTEITITRGNDPTPILLTFFDGNQKATDDTWGETWELTQTPKFFLCADTGFTDE